MVGDTGWLVGWMVGDVGWLVDYRVGMEIRMESKLNVWLVSLKDIRLIVIYRSEPVVDNAGTVVG